MTFNEIVKEKHAEALKKAEKQALDNKCKKLIENSSNQKSKNYDFLFDNIKNQINRKIGKNVFDCKNGIIKINSNYKKYFSKAQTEKFLDKLSQGCTHFSQSHLTAYLILADEIAKEIISLLKENEESCESSEEK